MTTADNDAATSENAAETADVEMAEEVVATNDSAEGEAAPAATGAPAVEPADKAVETPVAAAEAAAWDWKVLAGEDADALKLLGDYKSPAELLAEVKRARNWREDLAGGDEKTLAWLKRFNDKPSAMKSINHMRSMVGDKSLIKLPGPKATPEEIAEFRKQIGVPDDAKGYKSNLPQGAPEQTDFDKAVAENFLALAHKAGFTQDQVDVGFQAFEAGRLMAEKQQAANVHKTRQQNEDALRGDWGEDYRENTNLAKSWMGKMADEFGEDFLEIELKNGALLGDYVPFIKFAAEMGRMTFGSGAMESGEPMSNFDLDAEIEKIQAHIDTPKWSDSKLQTRLAELWAMKNRRNSRAA